VTDFFLGVVRVTGYFHFAMSRFKIRTTSQGTGAVKLLEFDRATLSSLSFDNLRSNVTQQHGIRLFSLGVQLTPQAGGFVYVRTDKDLQNAFVESARAGSKFVDMKVIPEERASPARAPSFRDASTSSGYSPSYSSPSSNNSNSYSSSNNSSPASSSSYNQPPVRRGSAIWNRPPGESAQQQQARSPASSSSSDGGESMATFTLQPDHGTRNEKIKVDVQQNQDFYLFSCVASMYETDVDVILEVNKLMFKSKYTVEDQNQGHITTYRYTQTFQLPFTPRRDDFRFTPGINNGRGYDVRLEVDLHQLNFGNK